MRWRAALISMVMLYLGLQAPGAGYAGVPGQEEMPVVMRDAI